MRIGRATGEAREAILARNAEVRKIRAEMAAAQRMSAPEFLTLRQACGLTQAEAGRLLGQHLTAVQKWEGAERPIPKHHADAMRNLDDLIRDRATAVLQPLTVRRPDGKMDLVRYRTADEYEEAERKHVAAGLPFAAYPALLLRVVDGLARLRIRYSIRWSDDAPAGHAQHHSGDGVGIDARAP